VTEERDRHELVRVVVILRDPIGANFYEVLHHLRVSAIDSMAKSLRLFFMRT
jgi:hypothetical protein